MESAWCAGRPGNVGSVRGRIVKSETVVGGLLCFGAFAGFSGAIAADEGGEVEVWSSFVAGITDVGGRYG